LVDTTAETYDPNGSSPATSITLGEYHGGGTETVLSDGSVLIVGGVDDAGNPSAGVERYYPGSNITTPIGTMAEARSGQTATLLDDGTVLIAGGWSSQSTLVTAAGLYLPDSKPLATPGATTPVAASPSPLPTAR
jgi:hypothetical protein